jgi:hypothetical protein
MHDYGTDYFSTLDSYPANVANSYGLYYLIGLLFGKVGFPFFVFWLFVSILLGYSFYVYLLNFSQNKFLDKFIIFAFTIGYVIPWFSFQNYRFGAALLLLLSGLGTGLKKSIFKIILAIGIHSISILLIPFLFIKKINRFFFFFFAIVVSYIFYLFFDDVTKLMLTYIGYENYISDFVQYSDTSGPNFLVFVRLILLIVCSHFIIKQDYYVSYFLFIMVYTFSIIFTPFYGRLTPFAILFILVAMQHEFSWFKILFLALILVDSYFSITKSIFHYEL